MLNFLNFYLLARPRVSENYTMDHQKKNNTFFYQDLKRWEGQKHE